MISNKAFNNPRIRAKLEEIATAAGLDSKVLVRAVKTRWNTVTEVLDRGLQMREVLAQLCDMTAFNSSKSSGVQLRRYTINDNEWEIIEQLFKLLHVSSSTLGNVRSLTLHLCSRSFTLRRSCQRATMHLSTMSSPRWISSQSTSTRSRTMPTSSPSFESLQRAASKS